MIAPPKPTSCSVEIRDGIMHGEARFDVEDMRAYIAGTSDESWIVRDEAGTVIGISSVRLMREAYSAQGLSCTNPNP